MSKPDPGDVNPWEYHNPLGLSFAHFQGYDKCPECGFGPGAHLHYIEGRQPGGMLMGRIQRWACPTEWENPLETLARLEDEA